jgi:hypothetical protein
MQKKVLSEQLLIYDNVSMPQGFEINNDKLLGDNLESLYLEKEFPFSKTWDMLNTYIKEHVNLKYSYNLVNKKTWGSVYKPQERTFPLLDVDPVDFKNSPDFTCLYGVKVKECSIRIHYDDNRRKNRSWDIDLKDNKFIMFPSINKYTISNYQKNSLNYIQTITYEYY